MGEKAGYTLKIEGEKDGDLLLIISGHLALANVTGFSADADKALKEKSPLSLTIDLEEVDYLDSAGAVVLLRLEDRAKTESIPFQYRNLSEHARNIMNLINREALLSIPPATRVPSGLIEEIGEAARRFIVDASHFIAFQGELFEAILHALRHPRSVRWAEVFLYFKRVGVQGLPIVALISALLGLIIAFMSSLQLKQFGANIYIAALVSSAVVRELGPIMTAILVAGRSGSAFAAEIGTMVVNEEVDALTTMGFDTTRFIAVPKVLATILAVPLLTLYADVFGIGGGAFVGVIGLDLSLASYIDWTRWSLTVFDIVSSMIKSVVFAVLIAGIGCQRGFQTQGGALAVGTSTTSAVVSAIFLIIVADSIFAVLFHYVR